MKDSEVEVEHLETYKIEEENYDLIFNIDTEEMTIEYYNPLEDEDYSVTIKDIDGFHLDESPEKDLSKLQKYFEYFRNYKGKPNC